MDVELDEWTNSLLVAACDVIIRYEEHLRSKNYLNESRALAKAMRELKDVIPPEVMEAMRR
jgi:hypothetical protein